MRAILYLAAQGTTCSSKDIAEDMSIPRDYLIQLAQLLRNAGIIEARPGKHGGYRLAKDPADTNVLEIMEALDDDAKQSTRAKRDARKGGAMVRTKLRNILTGRMQDITFRSGEKVEKPDLETRDMQFLYREDDNLIFMDMTSYEQMQMHINATDGKEGFLKDGQECRVLFYKGNPLDVDIPLSLVLEVVETEPGAKGDTVSNVTKAAKLETGISVQVPIFVNEGDRIKVDTRTKEYLGRE